MPSNKKPRKAYKPKYALAPKNMVGYVSGNVQLPDSEQLEPIQQNFNILLTRFLEEPNPTYEDWHMIRVVLMISQEIEKQGKVRNLQAEIDKIGEAIYDIFDRFVVFEGDSTEGVWRPQPFTQNERDELFWFKKVYRFQMENLSVGEYTACTTKVERQLVNWPKVMKKK